MCDSCYVSYLVNEQRYKPLRRLLLYLLHDVLQILDNLNMSRDPIESLDRRNRCRASFVHLRVAWIL